MSACACVCIHAELCMHECITYRAVRTSDIFRLLLLPWQAPATGSMIPEFCWTLGLATLASLPWMPPVF